MKDALVDFTERLAQLMRDDKELHDALVRLINATAELKEMRAAKMKQQLKEKV